MNPVEDLYALGLPAVKFLIACSMHAETKGEGGPFYNVNGVSVYST